MEVKEHSTLSVNGGKAQAAGPEAVDTRMMGAFAAMGMIVEKDIVQTKDGAGLRFVRPCLFYSAYASVDPSCGKARFQAGNSTESHPVQLKREGSWSREGCTEEARYKRVRLLACATPLR